MNVNIVVRDNSSFPNKLKTIYSVPEKLYYRGSIQGLTSSPVVSIVGSRAVSPYGRAVTSKFSAELASKGVVVVSGLALGVDSIAHQSCLEAGGITIAVLPSPVDKVYPASHRQLSERIIEKGGGLISEYGQDDRSEAFKSRFIARNRIVSGLCDILLITEASERSGTLHTANFALEQGRTVMVVPGNITSPGSKGTNNLIKAGALPVTGTDDILHQLGEFDFQSDNDIVAANEHEALILNSMKEGVTDAGIIQTSIGIDPALFNQTMTMLEITGKIRPLGAGHWTLS